MGNESNSWLASFIGKFTGSSANVTRSKDVNISKQRLPALAFMNKSAATVSSVRAYDCTVGQAASMFANSSRIVPREPRVKSGISTLGTPFTYSVKSVFGMCFALELGASTNQTVGDVRVKVEYSMPNGDAHIFSYRIGFDGARTIHRRFFDILRSAVDDTAGAVATGPASLYPALLVDATLLITVETAFDCAVTALIFPPSSDEFLITCDAMLNNPIAGMTV